MRENNSIIAKPWTLLRQYLDLCSNTRRIFTAHINFKTDFILVILLALLPLEAKTLRSESEVEE